MKLQLTLNGKSRELEVNPVKRLLDVLRDDFGLTGTKEGCGEGECGSCTVLLDDKPVLSCLTTVSHINGHKVTTIEGLAEDGELDVLQTAFVEETAIQCGFCTPGMIMSSKALLMHSPNPSEEEIRAALAGNICRCSGYSQIIRAVQRAAMERSGHLHE